MGKGSTQSKGKSQQEHHILNRMGGDSMRDPYMSNKGYPEPTICPVCSAVFHKKHWSFDNSLIAFAKKDPKLNRHKCPACRKIEDKYAMGKVLLSGTFIREHISELVNIIKSEERHAMDVNPMDRLILIEERDGGVYVETTSDALAMRIGHHLKKAYKGGEEEFDFRSGDKFVEVKWHKDQKGE